MIEIKNTNIFSFKEN